MQTHDNRKTGLDFVRVDGEPCDVKGRRLMRQKLRLLVLPVGMLVMACNTQGPGGLSGGTFGGNDGTNNSSGTSAGPNGTGPGSTPTKTALDDRVTDYNEAIRTATLKLVGTLPTLTTTKAIAGATDKKAAYAKALDKLFTDPRFNGRMVKFWRDAMRMGGNGLDTAPVLAAQLMSEGKPYTELFTAKTGTCPTFDGATNTFTSADCQNGVPTQAGVLSNPEVMSQFYSNMAFRRVRWVQETFVCTKFPAEVLATAAKIDGKDYTSPWDFNSIGNDPINFKDTKSVVCANCHTTINHLAPLFGNFDDMGTYQNQISVMTPVAPDPIKTQLTHWLVAGEKTSWRHGEQVADLPALGSAMATDPDVAECAVARMWNFAMSKEDIVADLATVPVTVLEPHIASFAQGGFDLKATLRDMMLSDDFTKF